MDINKNELKSLEILIDAKIKIMLARAWKLDANIPQKVLEETRDILLKN